MTPNPDLGKICTKCGQHKPLESYYRQTSHKSGRRSECKACFYKRIKARDRALSAAARWMRMTAYQTAGTTKQTRQRNPRGSR
jgi:hypothetical protein